MLSKRCEFHGIPDAEHVRLIGKGYQGEDHFGRKDPTARSLSSDFHEYEIPEEDLLGSYEVAYRCAVGRSCASVVHDAKMCETADRRRCDDRVGVWHRSRDGEPSRIDGVLQHETLV